MNRHAKAGSTIGCSYCAVGMHRAVDSPIGLPSRSRSASGMLGFLTPAEVRSSSGVAHPFRPARPEELIA